MMISRQTTTKRAYSGILALLFGVILISASLVAGEDAQQVESHRDRFEIPELGAVIVASHDGPRVTEVTPAGGRLEKYRTVDLQSGDLIMAANGQRLESLTALRELLSSLEAGAEVKMAVQRFESLKVVRFEIGTEADRLAAREMAANYVEVKAVPEAGEPGRGGPVIMKFEPGEGGVPCIELAAMLDDTDGQVRVAEIIDLPPQLAPPIELSAGDILIALQGQSISKTAEFVDQFDQIPAGNQVILKLIRNDSETELTFEKPKLSGKGMKIIKR